MAVPQDDPLFPTMVIGSLPRPGWVVDLIGERTQGRITDAEAESQLDDAVLSAIRMQEWAGLDYISDGEWRRENYARVFADRVGGFNMKHAPSDRQWLSVNGIEFSTQGYRHFFANTGRLTSNHGCRVSDAGEDATWGFQSQQPFQE